MGDRSDFSDVQVSGFQGAVENALREFGDLVYEATEEGLSAAEKVLVRNLKAATPTRSGKFKKAWKGTGKKYKMCRFVGNTTVVRDKAGTEISLANIFEYSTMHGNPFIKQTAENSIDEMAAAVVAAIKKEM